MAIIQKVWFDKERIFMQTDEGEKLSRPLEAFPVLKDASTEERMNFRIGKFGDDIRWEELDEDIHISSFYDTTEPNPNNEVGLIFKRFPQLDIAEMAHYIGINKSLLCKYIYGIKRPSEERMQQIKHSLNVMGQELIAV
ncbi:MAG: DUF2442 domain-containing protein [Prevotella sp.]|nr:DUF2442 domain-containing protein [Prevotella sp.]